jgi:hypothetical protein
MDLISHLFWSLTIFGNILDWKPILVILLISILPDLPWIDYYVHKFKSSRGRFKIISIFKSDKGAVLKYLHEKKPNFLREAHFFLHSLLAWLILTLIVWIFFSSYWFLSLVYLFHLLVDIFTHTGSRGPALFYPFSRDGFPGIEYEEHRWMVFVSYILLILINVVLLLIKIF